MQDRVTNFDYENICEMQQCAETIRKQIGIGNLMACGAREWQFLGWESKGQHGLRFRVNASAKRQFIEVSIEPDDTYTVVIYKLKRVTDERIELERATGIYCDMLGNVVYRMVNK